MGSKIDKNKYLNLLIYLIFGALLASGCKRSSDWKTQFSDKIGQEIIELDTAYLDEEYIDPYSSSLTRLAWAQLQDGSLVLLGLPPYGLDKEEIVRGTAILTENEWKTACARAFNAEEIWSWRFRHSHPGNSIRIYINNQNDRYCQFFFLPDGWELRTVVSHGIIKQRN